VADTSVRPAGPDDAPALAAVQAAAWQQAYEGHLPAADLVGLVAAAGSPESAAAWEAAVRAAPSPRHRVLVALDHGEVAGFLALAPTADPDLDPAADVEMQVLCVAPQRTGAGHGSRLVNAAADVLGEVGVRTLTVWVSAGEERLRAFLEAAGWAADGATRRLDLRGDGVVLVDQARLRTALGAGE